MSVQFDPLNLAALELRSNIWLGKPAQPRDITQAYSVVMNPLEEPSVPDWLLNDLANGPPQPPTPLHPLDPGIPGRHVDLVQPRVLQ